ncbi:RNA polymerase sigma factor [Plesiocystis pacifica]|uniref:RNA polymerase sigma factor n=1 Tax=Plesiocystis pacifica TaxID=191768 RepID=UPI000A309C2F|nr:RNA polymerase sigma factor [Plesiocystis pacifica]
MRGDLELLLAWRAGDTRAGNELVRRFFPSIYRFFRSKLEAEVEDLTQQVLLALVERSPHMASDSNVRAYLFGIARRKLLAHLRQRYAQNQHIASDVISVQGIAGESQESFSELVHAHRAQRQLLLALRRLPIEHQIVVELHYWEGMRIAEIAEVVEAAPGTVKSRLARARAKLQEQLGEGFAAADPSLGEGIDDWVSSIRALAGPPSA